MGWIWMSGYYEHFPAKSFNVSVQLRGAAKKHVLVANKAFGAGDVIYTVCVLSDVADDIVDMKTFTGRSTGSCPRPRLAGTRHILHSLLTPHT